MKPKVLLIGQTNIWQSLKEAISDWDFQIPVTSMEDFNEKRDQIDDNTSVVFFMYNLFRSGTKKEQDLFVKAVVEFAPYALVEIVCPEDDFAFRNSIQAEVEQRQQRQVEKDPSYNANTPVFYIDYTPEGFTDDTRNNAETFCSTPLIEKEVRDLVRSAFHFETDVKEEETQEEDVPGVEVGSGKVITVTAFKGGCGKTTTSTLSLYPVAEVS